MARGRRNGAYVGPYKTQAGLFESSNRDDRIAAGLTQEQIAKMAGVSVRTVRNWEMGITDWKCTFRIERVLQERDRAGPCAIAGFVHLANKTGNPAAAQQIAAEDVA
jgi:DNA-binding XRE family transcriptional regulator